MQFKIGAVIWRLQHRKIKNTPSTQTSVQKKELCVTCLLQVVLGTFWFRLSSGSNYWPEPDYFFGGKFGIEEHINMVTYVVPDY